LSFSDWTSPQPCDPHRPPRALQRPATALPRLFLIAGMRRLSLAPSASFLQQVRRAALSKFLLQSQWTARPDLRRFSSSAAAAVAATEQNTAAGPVYASPGFDACPRLPYRFETGIGLFAKRTPRPFPPPFLSPPSGSFSDPLSTHHRSRDRRAFVNGKLIQGCTNGDDAVFASEYFIAANDGVGAWSARPRGHAGFVLLFLAYS